MHDGLLAEFDPEHADEIRAAHQFDEHWLVFREKVAARWWEIFGDRRAWQIVEPAIEEAPDVSVVQVTRVRSVGAKAAAGWKLEPQTFESVGLEFRLNGEGRCRFEGFRRPGGG